MLAVAERDAARARYLARHPQEAGYFSDHLHAYSLYRLELVEIRVVVGFGRLSWVTPAEYFRAGATCHK